MDNHQRIVRANGADLNLLEAGAGSPALLFLHYWGGSSRTWAPTIAELSTTNRCIALDFRGWGASSKVSDDYSLQTLASDVVGVLTGLALERYVIVGHSMGGKVAQLVAARQPKGLVGLILFGPAPPGPMGVPEDVRRSYVGLYDTREGVETVISNLTPHKLPSVFREQIIEDGLKAAPDAKRAWPEQGMIEDISPTTPRINVPVHIIAGGDDAVEPEAGLHENFKAMPGVNFTVIPGVGHIAPLENPAALAEAIRSALQRE
jgi:pimeloyl-ACP methyl ester carboxylesterase